MEMKMIALLFDSNILRFSPKVGYLRHYLKNFLFLLYIFYHALTFPSNFQIEMKISIYEFIPAIPQNRDFFMV